MALKYFLSSVIIAFIFLINIEGAAAQASASASFTASATIIEPIGITTTSNMNFANIDAGNGGIVIITPEHNRIAQGDIILAEGGMVSAATFLVTGKEGYTFDISVPSGPQHVVSGTQKMEIRDFVAALDESSLSGNGKVIKVGASLVINAQQQPGFYQSLDDLQVTVNYN